jgi:hypothetical protein
MRTAAAGKGGGTVTDGNFAATSWEPPDFAKVRAALTPLIVRKPRQIVISVATEDQAEIVYCALIDAGATHTNYAPVGDGRWIADGRVPMSDEEFASFKAKTETP